ncbi:MAG: thiamine phosphate synthase [Chloroflexota bacterium]
MPELVLPRPVLMLVTDRRLAGGEDALVEKMGEAIAGGVNVVQLREQDMSVGDLRALATRVIEVSGGRAVVIVNNATVAGAGVHLPENAPSLGAPFGRSVHSVNAARRAEAEGAAYVVFGPVHETASHPGEPGVGRETLAGVVAAVRIPVVAIGGVTAERVGGIMGAGAAGVAVISAIFGSPSPHEAAREIWRELERSPA